MWASARVEARHARAGAGDSGCWRRAQLEEECEDGDEDACGELEELYEELEDGYEEDDLEEYVEAVEKFLRVGCHPIRIRVRVMGGRKISSSNLPGCVQGGFVGKGAMRQRL